MPILDVDANGKVPLQDPRFVTGGGGRSRIYSGLLNPPIFLEPNRELIERDTTLEKLKKSQKPSDQKPFNPYGTMKKM